MRRSRRPRRPRGDVMDGWKERHGARMKCSGRNTAHAGEDPAEEPARHTATTRGGTNKAARKGDEVTVRVTTSPVPQSGVHLCAQPWGHHCMIPWMGDDVNPCSCPKTRAVHSMHRLSTGNCRVLCARAPCRRMHS